MKVRFGPAGIPPRCKGDTLAGISFVAGEGLNAFEVQWVKGVRLSETKALEAKEIARKNDVELSAHAPYWINCCSKEKGKIDITVRNLLQSVRIAKLMGATCVVFHPGYYLGQSKEEALKSCLKTLELVFERAKEAASLLSPETTGKPTQFGSLEEVLEICSELGLKPTIDFAHLHARDNGRFKSKKDYSRVFEIVENELGSKVVKNLHCHFSEVEFNEKGEKRHLNLFTKNSPPLKELLTLIVELGYAPTMICETPKLDEDALRMKELYEQLKGKRL